MASLKYAWKKRSDLLPCASQYNIMYAHMTVPTLQCSTHYLFMSQVHLLTTRTVVYTRNSLPYTHVGALMTPGKHDIILQTHCAIVQVITMAPHHHIWQRCRRIHHGGAICSYTKPPSPRYGRTSPAYCEHCTRLSVIELSGGGRERRWYRHSVLCIELLCDIPLRKNR